ncbi:HAD-IB family phosphatase [Photobacterium sp. SDRW27]|uniref:HAD family hydrolase n=1 Tax=Photobacterium obscurum TaxID=2829490 RepID=UPI0022440B2A|nr:HAD-IB family phosphatase [Photobacterium obscurum]MCW8332043.1 HAD-IB family phosphatase [Photobacterium obscurum]
MNDNLPKICFFDMEGTLLKKNNNLDNGKVAPSAWTVLAKEIGDTCYLEEEMSKDKWLSGEYESYTEWMYDSIAIQQKHGLNRDIFEKVIEETQFQDGAKELVEYLHSRNIITVIISGGFKHLADKLQRTLKIKHSYSACEYFFDEHGALEHFNLLPTDEKGKLVFMEHLAEEYNTRLSQCLFIGDGKNDVFLAEKTGISISFNAQKELEEVSSFQINQKKGKEDLSDIKKLLIDIFK